MAQTIVRLKDIAARTGFSVNTVSLALRDSERIPSETRQRIRAAADELHYLPNFVAKSLVNRQTKTIGLVLTDVTNPVLTRVAQTVEQLLGERGYGTLFGASNNEPEEEVRVLEMFRARRVDGMLVYPRTHHELDAVRRLRLSGLPVVLLAGGPDCGLDVVGTDERRGAYKAVMHLVELGHRRIAMIDCSMRHQNAGKRSGYRQALADAGIAVDPVLELVPDGHTVGHGCRSCARLLALPDRPTALFTSTDSIALGALRACQLAGVSVPRDLAICGFDNIEYGEYATTPLSSVNYSVGTVARRAVGRLLELIDGGEPLPEPIATMIDPALVLRESTLGPA